MLRNAVPREAIVVGGGISGLIAALELQAKGISTTVLESEGEIGGRVRTDEVNGFLLDRGFQILLAGYPWVQKHLDLAALDFRPVKSGALIWDGKKFQRLVDPLRHPSELAAALVSPILKWGDRLRLGKMAAGLYPAEPRSLLAAGSSRSTESFLTEMGFSPLAILSFFRPFFGGIFLDPALATNSALFRFLFRVFGTGPAGFPARGMGAVCRQLAMKLPRGSVRTGAKVSAVKENTVYLESGEILSTGAVIVATDQGSRGRILPGAFTERPWLGSVTLYFEAPESPVKENLLVLNGSGHGFVNSLIALTDVAPEYAPAGKTLLSVSLLGVGLEQAEARGEALARAELSDWYGEEKIKPWKLLKAVVIPQALPQFAPNANPSEPISTAMNGVFACGDYLSVPSQDGAASSAERAAAAAAAYLDALG